MSDTEKKTVGLSKKTLIILAVAAVLVLWGISAYNGMVSVEEKATTEWAKVQSSYQRRADLIPNLVNTVKGYATHEKETLEGVISARAKATSINIDASNLTPEQVQKYQAAQGELTQALGKLIAIGEAYSDLKANENFIDLQKQLEGTENRINEARNSFNKAVQEYNIKIRKFPNSLLAGLFGFDKMAKFEAEAGADKAPEVKF